MCWTHPFQLIKQTKHLVEKISVEIKQVKIIITKIDLIKIQEILHPLTLGYVYQVYMEYLENVNISMAINN